MITEECSCGAKISLPAESPAYADKWAAIMQAISEWRTAHVHEFAPVEPMPEDPPTIVESGSSHERMPEYWDTEDRVRIGFTREIR